MQTGLEAVPIATLIQILTTVGPFGLVLVLWWVDLKNLRNLVEAHRQEVSQILEQYKTSHSETKQMYKDNAELVKQTQSLADSLKELVVMNTETMTRLSDDVRANQYCPAVRLEKKTEIHARREG